MTAKILGPIGIKAFESRGLSPETVTRYSVYTASKDMDGDVVPDEKGNIVVFPFIENGVTVAEKYRAPGKKFWQRAGGRRTFWNSDALDDPALCDGRGGMALVITEGEIDALTAIDCGFPLSVSVPDGAPAVPEGQRPDDVGTDRPIEETGKFEFLWNNRTRLKPIKRFILAVDSDGPGQRLAAELVRRLSASRCLFVTYPAGCKDLSDVMVKHGPEAVSAVLNNAQNYPVRGLFTLADYPERPQIETFSSGWSTMDPLMKVFVPSFTVVTGVPGHGKSSWLTNLVVNLAEQYDWPAAIFSPEMPIVPHLRDKIRRIRARKPISSIGHEQLAETDKWIDTHFVFIDHTSNEDEDITLEWLIARAEDAVLRYGIRVFVIDPWNEIEHAKRNGESMTEYINRAIRQLKKFEQQYEIALYVVAHPTKDVGKDGKSRVPSLYDVDGSAAWFNKPDIGIVIDRPDPSIDESVIYISKVRFEGTGEKGKVRMHFDRHTSRYELLNHDQTLELGAA